ncbi:protein SULFUR DEFICIENCY-INDUCED 1 isoform X2 [Cryptomeria japonica]|uniref:protein SULFUR DEFICIENCY-INDUCED 1 isoform X2 n=1 Tax=Cryptomeria japonica TaxID=3369 RepID=UPI0027DA4A3E|nr:protein SULFUR DEFICIENCY-INDUCED 1 isoform X2 [Cryptomeria japonica]
MLARDKSSAGMKEFGIKHKVPVGDTPYIRAKQVQLVEKNPEAAIALFWAAINAGDRVESALKDMAIVMKQLGRADEAIEAIKSFRHRCSLQAQESLDNVLLDLYKSNLGWAYMQQNNYVAAEVVYRKAQYFVMDANKACNLGVCLMKQGKLEEAIAVLKVVNPVNEKDFKSLEHAKQLLKEIHEFQVHGGSKRSLSTISRHIHNHYGLDSTLVSDGGIHYSNNEYGFLSSSNDLKELLSTNDVLDMVNWEVELDTQINLTDKKHRRLPVFEEIIHSNDFSP